MAGVPVEVEVKLAGGSQDLVAELSRLRWLDGYRVRDRGERVLETTYLDTADLALARAGLVLRVRRGPHGVLVSVKGMGVRRGNRYERPELECPLRRVPPLPWKSVPAVVAPYVTVYAAGRPLKPLLRTIVRRHLFEVERGGGAEKVPIAELVCDRVEVGAPGRKVAPLRYAEVEVEQCPGAPLEELDRVVRLLQQRFALRASAGSKFETGMKHFHRRALWRSVGGAKLGGRRMRSAWATWREADVALRLGRSATLAALRCAVGTLLRAAQRSRARWLERELAWLEGELEAAGAPPVAPGTRSRPSATNHTGRGEVRAVLRCLNAARYLRLVRAVDRWVEGSNAAEQRGAR